MSIRRRVIPALAGLLMLCACGPIQPGVESPTPPTATVATPFREPLLSAPASTEAPSSKHLEVTTADRVAACVSKLPLKVRIGQTMLVTTNDVARVRDWLRQGLIAGILANGRLTGTTAVNLRSATKGNRYGALLAADEEGGGVQRYSALAESLPSQRTQAATMTPREVERMWREHAGVLRKWGVDLVLAPVVDVGHGPGIGSRAYSGDPDSAAEYGLAAVKGIDRAGLIPVLKHFPGHGRASGDSHTDTVTGPGIESLRRTDLVPYEHILEADVDVAVLVGHTSVPGYSRDPSSQSAAVVEGLLRGDLKFQGLVVSDALGMAAADQPTQGDALVGFLAAGGDLGIVGPYGSVEGRKAVRAALADGRLDSERIDEAAGRVLEAKGIDPCALSSSDVQEGATSPDGGAVDGDLPSDPPVVNPTRQP